jgi:hypothetical protein
MVGLMADSMDELMAGRMAHPKVRWKGYYSGRKKEQT